MSLIINPLVTVIITTFNRRNLLPYAIQSILDQTYTNYEIIVINDYGEDVWDVIQSFNSKKILYLSSIKNSGPAFARNTANNIAKGEYICYLDDDDIFLPMHLEISIKGLLSNKVNIVYTNAFYVDEVIINKQRITRKEYTKPIVSTASYNQLLISNFIPINTLIYKASLLDKVEGFDETLNSLEDWEFFIRLASLTSFLHINEYTVKITNRILEKDNISDFREKGHYKVCKDIYSNHPSGSIRILRERQRALFNLCKKYKKLSRIYYLPLHAIIFFYYKIRGAIIV